MHNLTGRIRHRIHLGIAHRGSAGAYLVLQVEYQDLDGLQNWRDARVEDLTTITLNSLKEVKQQ